MNIHKLLKTRLTIHFQSKKHVCLPKELKSEFNKIKKRAMESNFCLKNCILTMDL